MGIIICFAIHVCYMYMCAFVCVLFRYVRMCVCAFLWSLKYEAYHLEIAHVFSAKVNEF